jgi:hypothetical protein
VHGESELEGLGFTAAIFDNIDTQVDTQADWDRLKGQAVRPKL